MVTYSSNRNQETLPNSLTPSPMTVVDIDTRFIHTISLKSHDNSPTNAVKIARDAFNSGKTKDVKFREQQLKMLSKMYKENTDAMCEVLAKDLRKSKFESIICEVEYLKNDLINLLKNFKSYTKPERKDVDVKFLLEKLMVYNDPYGVVLIVGAWNYPIQLTLLPLAGAIAAG